MDVITALSKKLAKQLDVPIVIEPTLDRRKALDGANYVISTATALGGREARVIERKIMLNYGLDVSSGCTTGLGGVFRTMRYAPLMLGICRDMEELCPDAWLFHYANPTTTVPLLLNEASPINSMGLCHSVQHTAQTLVLQPRFRWIREKEKYLRCDDINSGCLFSFPTFNAHLSEKQPYVYSKEMMRKGGPAREKIAARLDELGVERVRE